MANLDQASGGRIICIVGLGYSERDFASFGQASAKAIRAKQLDEGLAILAGLWTQASFSLWESTTPLSRSPCSPSQSDPLSIPLWVVAGWPHRAPFRRAAQWDGVCVKAIDHQTYEWMTVEAFREAFTYVHARCAPARPFEVIMSGQSPGDQQEAGEKVRPFEEAGSVRGGSKSAMVSPWRSSERAFAVDRHFYPECSCTFHQDNRPSESNNLWYSTDNVKARQIADRWLDMRRYNTHGVSRYKAIQCTSFEDREPLVERVLALDHGPKVHPFLGQRVSHLVQGCDRRAFSYYYKIL